MFQKALILMGLSIMAIAFRSCRLAALKKLGALTIVVVTFLIGWFFTDTIYCGLSLAGMWLFLPWIELLTRVRKARLPIDNRLQHFKAPTLEFFPHASQSAHDLEEHEFEMIGSSGWDWEDMKQQFITYWHPDECAIATICLCHRADVAFSFLSITSQAQDGRVYRSTNFPLSPTLKAPAHLHYHRVPCSYKRFGEVMAEHRKLLEKNSVTHDCLRMPDPDEFIEQTEKEMQVQLETNRQLGLIRYNSDQTFTYTPKGLLYLWMQFLKDMIRFC